MIETTQNLQTWAQWCREVNLNDLYWNAEHYALWMRAWGCQFLGARMTCGGIVLKAVLLQPLDNFPRGEGLFHATSPYDFGGARSFAGPAEVLLERFGPVWIETLRGHGVVSEFNRLHPFYPVPSDAIFHANNYVIDLTLGYDRVRAGYSSSWRYCLKTAERSGLRCHVFARPSANDVQRFSQLYNITMDRVGADHAYRFSSQVFEQLLSLPELTLYIAEHESQAVASLLIASSGVDRFYHLSASRPTEKLNPSHLLLDRAVKEGISTNARWLHLGGGQPNLRNFKRRMSSGEVPYYVLKRVIDEARYASLACEETNRFPAFRGAL